MRLTDNADIESLRVQAEARYRNGQYSAALEPLRKAESRRDEPTESDPGQHAKIHALIAMAEAKLGHRTEAETAQANYRRLWAEANTKATTPPPLMAEVEQTMSEAFKTTGTAR
jgi:Flp pilus assembly protein TadD